MCFSHILLKHPNTCGTESHHGPFESVTENLKSSLCGRVSGHRGKLHFSYCCAITMIKGTPFLTIKSKIVIWSESLPLSKCIMCKIKLFVNLVICLEKKRVEIWCARAALWGHVCSCSRLRGHFSLETALLLHCSAAYLHLTLKSSHECRVYLLKKNLSAECSHPDTPLKA